MIMTPFVTLESEQPVGVPCYQWVGCRDHAGLACFPLSGSWQAQGGPAYICREQRKRVYNDMGPLTRAEQDLEIAKLCSSMLSNSRTPAPSTSSVLSDKSNLFLDLPPPVQVDMLSSTYQLSPSTQLNSNLHR